LAYGYLNGKFLPREEILVHCDDTGFQYGLGVFETIKVTAGQPVWLQEHLDRLEAGMKVLYIAPPLGRQEIFRVAERLINSNRMTEGSMKITVTAGSGGLVSGEGQNRGNVVITVKKGCSYSESMYRTGFHVKTVSSLRRNWYSPFNRIKSINFGDNVLARMEALKQGAGEGLLVNSGGYVAEGSVSNIFWYDGELLKTPAVRAGILPGITRGKVIALAVEAFLPVREVLAEIDELHAAREIFLTNSLMGVMPVTVIDGKTVADGLPGPVTRLLAERLKNC